MRGASLPRGQKCDGDVHMRLMESAPVPLGQKYPAEAEWPEKKRRQSHAAQPTETDMITEHDDDDTNATATRR
jgi:hypothetical protein